MENLLGGIGARIFPSFDKHANLTCNFDKRIKPNQGCSKFKRFKKFPFVLLLHCVSYITRQWQKNAFSDEL